MQTADCQIFHNSATKHINSEPTESDFSRIHKVNKKKKISDKTIKTKRIKHPTNELFQMNGEKLISNYDIHKVSKN